MTFFNINGWNVPIVNGGMTEASSPYGNSGKSFTNKQLIRRRMVPRSWTGKMLFQTPSVADTVEGLLMGRGHHFSFDRDFWSDSGIAPATLSDLNVSQGGGEQRFGTGYARFDGIALVSVSFNVDFPANKWTVIVWGDVDDDGDWHQYAEKANGDTYTDGELQSPALTSFVSVSDGVLTINQANFPTGAAVSGKKMDDLVLLPFNADSSFIADLYAWQTDNGVLFQCPFDYPGDLVDRVGYKEPSITTATFASGDPTRKIGSGSLLFDDDTGEVAYPTIGTDLELDNNDDKSVAFWIRPSSVAGGVEVIHQGAGLAAFSVELTSGGVLTARWQDSNAVRMEVVDSLVDEEWSHVCLAYSSTSSLILYKNGASVGTDSIAALTGGINATLDIGQGGDTRPMNMEDLRIYGSTLTPAQIYDIYNEGLYGYDYIPPSARAFSKLPRLLVSGDCIGSQHPKQVIGKVNSESYVQHGGTYSPNDRSIEMLLQEVSPLREEGIPSPDGNFILSPEFIINNKTAPIERQSCSGGYQYEDGSTGTLTPPTPVYDSDDSFGFCLDFDGATDGILLPSDINGGSNIGLDLGGHNSVTVAAWFNVNATGSQYDILSLPVAAGLERLVLRINSTNIVTLRARSTSASPTLATVTSTAEVAASKWYFVAGIIYPMSITAGLMRLYGNIGAVASNPTLSLLAENASAFFATTEFSAETDTSATPGQNHIGINFNATAAPFNGKIKSVMMWKRALESDELISIFRKGYERRIFR